MTIYIVSQGLMWIGIFYAILALIIIGFVVMGITYGAQGITVGGFGGTSIIVLFVFGIILFYQFLKVGFSCSVSRKTVFLSLLIAGLIFAVIIGIANMVFASLMELLPADQPKLIDQYFEFYEQVGSLLTIVSKVSLDIASGLLGMFFGYFVGALYYRMSTALKVIVSVGTVMLLLFVLPASVSVMSKEALTFLFGWTFALESFASVSPLNLSLLLVAYAVLPVLLFWLLIRRAPVKEK
jgi:hypothetical protein